MITKGGNIQIFLKMLTTYRGNGAEMDTWENNSRRNEIRRHREIKLICWQILYPAFLRDYVFFLNSTLEERPPDRRWNIRTYSLYGICGSQYGIIHATIRVLDENQSQPFSIKSTFDIMIYKYEY